MAEKIGDAYVNLGVREKDLSAGLNRGMRAVKGFAIAASGIFAGVAAGRGIGGLVTAYSDAIETTNKFNEVFSGASQDINKVAKDLADSYGLIGTSSRKLLADTGDILVGFGFTEDSALDLAKQTNQLAVDLASFTNIEGGAARASQALTKALVGETEQAKALGIVIRQNSEEFKGIVKRLIQTEGRTLLQAKALAALEIATNQSKKAQGDYARTQDELANQMRLAGEKIRDVKIAMGSLVVRFTSADSKVKTLNESLADLATKLKGITGAQIRTTAQITKMIAKLVIVVAVFKKMSPLIVTYSEKLAILTVKAWAAVAALSALQLGMIAVGAAGAAGFGAFLYQLGKLISDTEKLIDSMDRLKAQEQEMKERFGVQTAAALRRRRREMKAQGLDTRTGTAAAAGGGSGVAKQAARGPSFAFGAFADAIKAVQSSLGANKAEMEQKKQTSLLSSVDKGIAEIAKRKTPAIVGA